VEHGLEAVALDLPGGEQEPYVGLEAPGGAQHRREARVRQDHPLPQAVGPWVCGREGRGKTRLGGGTSETLTNHHRFWKVSIHYFPHG